MKRLLLTTVILCTLSTIQAQTFKAELFLAPSFPLGDYGTTDINSEAAEAATIGLHAGAMGHLMITNNISGTLYLGYNGNALDEEELEKQFSQSSPAASWRFQGEHFQWIYAAIGPTFGHYTEGGYIRLSPFGGPAWFLEQEVNVTTIDDIVTSRSKVVADSKTNIVYGINLAGGFYLVERVSIGLNLTYMTANTSRNIVRTSTSNGYSLIEYSDGEKFEPQIFTAGISIGFDF
jgi:hypothetical protein